MTDQNPAEFRQPPEERPHFMPRQAECFAGMDEMGAYCDAKVASKREPEAKPERAIKIIHAWFFSGNTGTVLDVSGALRQSKAGVAWQFEKLREMGLIKAIGRRAILGQGKPPTIWASTGEAFPAPAPKPPKKKRIRVHKPKIERAIEDPGDLRPLSKIPAATIVAQALTLRTPIEIAWSKQA